MTILHTSEGKPYELKRKRTYETIDNMNPFQMFRASLKMTQKEVGALLGIEQTQYGHYESGERLPTLRSWIKMKMIAKENGIELTDEMLNIDIDEPIKPRKKSVRTV